MKNQFDQNDCDNYASNSNRFKILYVEIFLKKKQSFNYCDKRNVLIIHKKNIFEKNSKIFSKSTSKKFLHEKKTFTINI